MRATTTITFQTTLISNKERNYRQIKNGNSLTDDQKEYICATTTKDGGKTKSSKCGSGRYKLIGSILS